LLERFPDEESAKLHLGNNRWGGGPQCPRCKAATKHYRQRRDGKKGYYLCHNCKLVYTVRTGTIFECSHVPLHKLLFAIYQVVTVSKGISIIPATGVNYIVADIFYSIIANHRFYSQANGVPK
jgi:hypothetical protein